MHRLERLINLVAALLDTERPLTVSEVSERVAGYPDSPTAFHRAFERDKETLRELGVPIERERLHDRGDDSAQEGYRIRREAYEMADPGLDPDELAALHLAASAVHLEGAHGLPALWKLGGVVAEQGPAPAVATLPGAVHLDALFRAVSERRRASFGYHGRPRSVDPHGLAFRNGHWYLAGWDHDAGEDRSFRLDRIESEVSVGEETGAFSRPPGPPGAPAPPWQLGNEPMARARLAVDGDQAGWAVGQLGPAAVRERNEDGSVVLEVEVTNRPAFRSFVLGFLDHAEVLGPPDLRNEVVSWLEQLAAQPGG
ncbi:MAG: helix-turn-helix transcriptional regulator [Acidimicrobiales bacterium]